MAMEAKKALLIGISGVSSSGKTTLARLLRDTWPNALILHEDDFYLPDGEIPVKEGLADWDCLEAINQPAFIDALNHIRSNGTLPPSLDSKEDKNSVGQSNIDLTVVASWRDKAEQILSHTSRKFPIVIIDGFLLYAQGMETIWQSFDLKLFLRTTYEKAKARREARTGYVTIEGFWEDPPGYIDRIVWPNYVKDHAFLFESGDVEGSYNHQVCDAMALKPIPHVAENDITACFVWACEMLAALYEP